jgi:hypothetical protein
VRNIKAVFLPDAHFWIACMARHFKSPTYLPTAVMSHMCIDVTVDPSGSEIVMGFSVCILFLHEVPFRTKTDVVGGFNHHCMHLFGEALPSGGGV